MAPAWLLQGWLQEPGSKNDRIQCLHEIVEISNSKELISCSTSMTSLSSICTTCGGCCLAEAVESAGPLTFPNRLA